MKRKFRFLTFVFFIPLFIFLSTQGCSQRRTSSVTTTEVSRDTETDSPRARYDANGAVTTTETKTVEVDEHPDRESGLFSIVGEVIALPFRAVGALFSAIF